MAVAAAAVMEVDGSEKQSAAKLTKQVILCSFIAAFAGLMFGYDIGISGGVTSMDDFLKEFFPAVYTRNHKAREDNYCKYDNQLLQLFTSSLYLAALVSSFFASKCCKKFGRKRVMQAASALFLAGAVLNVAARNLPMLIVGRLLLGLGIGCGNQAVPLFISEIAPAKHRGALNIIFQLLITVGILGANLVNFATSHIHPWGWRLSLGGAALPAVFLALGSLWIVETPTSLIERGKTDEGLATLQKIRGVHDVQKEYEEILLATELAREIKHPFKNLMKRSSMPQLVCGTILQVFQQFTGMNVIMFYAPVLFQTIGFGGDASLLSAVVTGLINVGATGVAMYGVDRFGRKRLLIGGAVLMFIGQCITGGILSGYLKSTNVIPKNYAFGVVALICIFVSGFACSWGPLAWLIPSEIYPLETRHAGMFMAVSTNMISTFIIAQVFLTMLCHMRSGIFFFFCAWICVMGVFVRCFLPETKGIPIDEMNEKAWKKHWFWRRCFDQYDTDHVIQGDNAV